MSDGAIEGGWYGVSERYEDRDNESEKEVKRDRSERKRCEKGRRATERDK